ncbi:glycosyltransferase family 4 protein [Rapidithrix thailandica]|uniref:Glycosyltransferase family 4 protein n=1 Tax=Rapidithrix thailandica TaxID=413964 RepID=A0AAW9S6V7_9BACT
MKILILAPYPKTVAPSQRFRFEQYLEAVREKGWKYDYVPFIDETTWAILHQPGQFVKKALGILRAFLKRFFLLSKLSSYDYVFIHREASHIGPPLFEWLIAKVFRKKMIYDFDDAIWLPNFSKHNESFHWLKMYGKVKSIMKWSYKISAGNRYLADFARKYNPEAAIVINPTTIDTEHYHNQVKDQSSNPLVIGWTGTLTTTKYLKDIVPALKDLEQKYNFEFHVIANEDPEYELKSYRFVKWKKETEIEDLLQFNVGVMPLVDDAWAKGKCGFKALQYMALGIPALVSPVGVNEDIVDHQRNGFVCRKQQDWYEGLEQLLKDAEARTNMGEEARKKIEDYYSVKANTKNFLSLFS